MDLLLFAAATASAMHHAPTGFISAQCCTPLIDEDSSDGTHTSTHNDTTQHIAL